MSYEQWLANGWLRPSEPSTMIVANLLSVVDRDLADAACRQIHLDNRYVHAYNAGRSLCALALAAEGYAVPKGSWQHQRQLESLELTLGEGQKQLSSQLLKTKKVRHDIEYEAADLVEARDVEDLLLKVQALRADVVRWLKQQHPELMPPGVKP